MKSHQTIRLLEELFTILCRSLPAYLADAKPWSSSAAQGLRDELTRIVADERRYAKRTADAIIELGGQPDAGRFPDEFASKNDLSLDFLRDEIVERQQWNIAAIEHCAAQLESTAALHSLAEEILGNARGHLDILKELSKADDE
jgi:hypothetical protein